MTSISFIGAGNLAGSLIRGLTEHGVDASALAITDCDTVKAEMLARKCPGVTVRASNREAAADCGILIACVKPGDVRGVCKEVGPLLRARSAVLVSVAAGVTTAMLTDWTHRPPPLVRCMPNTPVAVGCGMSVLYASADVSRAQRDAVERIFAAVGDAAWLEDEAMMDAVTALSGSGPAYFFRVIEALAQGAGALGMDAATAQKLTVQTALGAATLARCGNADPATLRQAVTSKGGTTEQALASLEHSGIDAMFAQALAAAARRSAEISRELERPPGDDRGDHPTDNPTHNPPRN